MRDTVPDIFLVKVTHPLKSYPVAKAIVLGFIFIDLSCDTMSEEEHFLLCEAASGKPTRRRMKSVRHLNGSRYLNALSSKSQAEVN